MLTSVKPATMKRSMKAVATATIASTIGISSRYERSEDEQQHDERHEQAEDLLDPLFDRRELGVAVELDDDPRRLDLLAHGVLDGDDRVAVLCLDRLVELRFGVRDSAVIGERLLAERIADALDPGVVLGRARTRPT